MEVLKYKSRSICPDGRYGGIRVQCIRVLTVSLNIRKWNSMSKIILDKHLPNDLSAISICRVKNPPLQLGSGGWGKSASYVL